MGKDGRYLASVKLAAIGAGTAQALRDMGLMADYIPEVYDAAHLGAGLPADGKVLILRAEIGSPALTEAFKERTIAYDDIPVYKTVYENPRSEELRTALEAGEVPFVTFTSASTVKGLVSSVGADADFSRFTALCIGEQTAAEAKRHGMAVKIARAATIDAVVELAREAAAKQ